MAYLYTKEGRIFVPAPQLIDPTGTLILTPMPPHPPPFRCYPVPLPSPNFHNPVYVPQNHPAFAAPVAVRVDPAFLIRVGEQRNHSLIQFMRSEGLVPSEEMEKKREDVIERIKGIVFSWIKTVALKQDLAKDVIATTEARLFAFGSYGLGVHGTDSDIDVLCVGPHFATLEEDFFVTLHNMLRSRPEVSEIQCVKSAKVPLMKFKFNGISVDFPYAQLQVVSVPNNVDAIDPSFVSADDTSWRSLSGVRANLRIRQLVPNLKNFQLMLRCVKLWARRRGIYSHLHGFFGGIHLAILAAHVCQRHPNASIYALLSIFFQTFSNWHWPDPVILQDCSIPYRRPDGRSLMPIMMPCSPFDWCNSNITKSTFVKIKTELQRASSVMRDLKRMDLDWSRLFQYYPYTKNYDYFVRILLAAPDGDELHDWVGWVKSRFRALLLKLEMVSEFCDPNPTEYVDHVVAEPNTVFYWGLRPDWINFINIESIEKDFMKIINKDRGNYNGSSRFKLKLSIVHSSQLPKNVEIV